ncbi:MAG: ZPR1 zinc finger domain-containing protein [Candidatus Methanomethylicaceae archaeon]
MIPESPEERREIVYKAVCASCGEESLDVKEAYVKVPCFGNMLILSMLCSRCGYRVFDTLALEYRGPSKIEYSVRSVRDLSARVIRSTTSTILIPELGLELRPGPRSEAFITNIEGVLDRFLAIAEQLYRGSEGNVRERAKRALERIKLAMDGKIQFRIIIDDEAGNSAIVPPEEA